jgi:Protein of unknown function (DUF1566)
MRPDRVLKPYLWSLALFGAGCNELAGIHEPLDLPDFSGGGSLLTSGTASGGSSSTAASGAAAGGEPVAGGSFGGSSSSNAGSSDQGGGGGTAGALAAIAIAHAFAEWPIPNPPATGLPNPQTYDTVSTSGIVVDRVTGLSWQRSADHALHSASDAQGYCAGLKLSGGGWRLPTRIELLSLLDVSAHNPLIDSVVFPATPFDHAFWSASPVASDALSSWSVAFGFGDGLAFVSPRNASLYTRCVRAEQAAGATPRYTIKDGFVSDENTQLMWEQPLQTSTFGLTQAAEYCKALAIDGGGWRLPSVNELVSLIDESRAKPAIDADAFPSTPVDFFWTSSPVTGFASYGWTISFEGGVANFFDGSQQHAVRCVR